MNRHITYLLLLLILVSCKERLIPADLLNGDATELKGVEAYMDGNTPTKAPALDAYNYVGRSTFVNNDKMVLTSIKRTASTIAGFDYSGIVYDHVVEQGQTSGGWNRDNTKGRTAASEQAPERIYWSDAVNGHTFIGYSVPQGTFDWYEKKDVNPSVYYGSLGDPTQLQSVVDGNVTNYIDYTNDQDETPVKDIPDDPNSALSYKSGNEKIKNDDVLLTYDVAKVAETGGSVAKLYFHHGLAQVRVIVNIQGFSASSTAVDSRSIVSDMILKDMLTLYKWRQLSYEAEALADSDAAGTIYGFGVAYDQKKDVHMWIPRPEGTGSGIGKQFTFYGLAVPTTMTAESLNLEFTVKYQDPMNPWKDNGKTIPNMIDHTYKAQMPVDVQFRAGYCTTINISLNHSNEEMTVGAEYMDWQLVETPDEGELKKNLTFMEHTDRNKVTILGDPLANEDDATWLYVDKTTNKIVDIYGNDGSQELPFKISTADQLLSFAYEVKGTSRTSTSYKGLDNTDHTLGDGFDFTGYCVTLDADITMQKSLEDTDVIWPGIGDDTHFFNGVFNGGYRHINKLYGKPLFMTVGDDAVVDHIFMTDALGITGRGSIAEVNNGVICGAYIEGDVEATNSGALAGSYCGSIVGENRSILISCGHIGDVKGSGYESVGALVGYNDGIVAICYNCGDVICTGAGENSYAGIGKYTPRSIAYSCYFNNDLYHGEDYIDLTARIGHVAFPLTTAMMQSNVFVNKPAEVDSEGQTTGGEIIDDHTPKSDPFFFHLSLNGGIQRAVVSLKKAVVQDPDGEGKILIHAARTGDNPFEDLRLKKTLVQWLIDHYSTETSPGVLQFSHQFQYIPGAYPRLK